MELSRLKHPGGAPEGRRPGNPAQGYLRTGKKNPAEGEAKVTLFASGTEVAVAVAAREALQAEGIGTRVVSTPCWELFETQPISYRQASAASAGWSCAPSSSTALTTLKWWPSTTSAR